jgi:diguanylate cyclase (GGDEF)-like protein/PAS domain S-box-containing protein
MSMRAALYVVGICLSLIALEVWREIGARNDTIARAEVEMSNLAHSLVQHADDTFELAETELDTLVWQLEKDGMTPWGLERARATMNSAVKPHSRISGLFVFDQDGYWQLTTREKIPEGANNADREYFQYHRASASIGTHLGPPVKSKSTGQWVLTMTRRINDAAGNFNGVVLATVDAKYFIDFYSQFALGQEGSITLLNADGIVMARMPNDETAIGMDRSQSDLFTRQIKLAPSGTYAYASPVDGVKRMGGYYMSDRYPFILLAAVSENEATTAWRQAALQRGLTTLVLVLLVGALGMSLAEQIGRRQKSEDELAQREAEYRLIAENASDLVERFNRDGKIVYASPASLRVVGTQRDKLLGTSGYERVLPDDMPGVFEAVTRLSSRKTFEETVAYRSQHGEGHEVWLETSLRVASSVAGGPEGVIAVTRDISARKALEIQLESIATRDGLTGLVNRRAFDEALDLEVRRARRESLPLSLIMVDVDRFKYYNDTYGHLAGDACLKVIANTIALAAKRPGDIAARYGGEEMALILPNTNAAGVAFIAGEMCRQVQALNVPHERNVPWQVATISIGVATLYPDEDEDATANGLILSADAALYAAKGAGRNRYSVMTKQQPLGRMMG